MNNLTNDKLIQELEMKILSSKEEFDDSELTRIYSKSKSSSDRNYFFVVLGIISLLAFIFSMLVYCYCRKKSISNGIRYIGQNGLKTEFFRIWFRFNEKKTKSSKKNRQSKLALPVQNQVHLHNKILKTSRQMTSHVTKINLVLWFHQEVLRLLQALPQGDFPI